MDVSNQCKTYRKSQGLPLGTFAFRIPLKRRGLNSLEFGVRMSRVPHAVPGLSRDWGSCHDGCWRMRIVGGLEALPEAGAERAVVDGAADLEQPIGTAPRPAHLLRFVDATIDEEVGCSFGQRRANPQPGPVPFAVVDQPIALPDEVAVQRPQRSPQLARGRDGSAAAGLATEVMHHRADAIDADLRILGLAIPGPPAQALNLLDDHRLRGRALRTIGQQASGNLRQVPQPHGDMKPVEDRKPLDASVERNAPQPGTAVGKRRQHCALGPPDRIEAAADQACEIRVGLRHGAEDLPLAVSTLPIRTSRCRWPAPQLRMKVEPRVTTIASARVGGGFIATCAGSAAAILNV